MDGANLCESCECVDPSRIIRTAQQDPDWLTSNGECPSCVQQALLHTRLAHGNAAMYRSIRRLWPLDSRSAFPALPTPLRIHADPRYTGRGITVAHIDSGYYPHPDLTRPRNRIRAWAETTHRRVDHHIFDPQVSPAWPGSHEPIGWHWHGLMTTTAAFGNGFLSHGLYRGVACDADLVLVQTWDDRGRITNRTLTRALKWILKKREELQIRVVSISVAGDPVTPLVGNSVDTAVRDLVTAGVTVIAASGNKLEQNLVPPATAPDAITVGGLDDRNHFDREKHEVWHSNYDRTPEGRWKPEVVAPSLWVVAPVLPGSHVATEALDLFARRDKGDQVANHRIAELKLVTPHYQHVEGTSFAAPIIAGVVACMLQANPCLTPLQIREMLIASAYKIPGAPPERQGAGAVEAGRAVELALAS